MLLFFYLQCFLFFGIVEAVFYPPGTEQDYSKCKVHYSRSGSAYKDFYDISKQKHNGSLLDFHFSVLAPSDAHILLASSKNVKKSDPAYEIVIGAGGNTFSDIRRMQKSEVKATVRGKDLLTALDFRSFWLHISKDGLIEVGKEGEELAFLSWTDLDPIPLKVISFSTWPGIEAKWFFDCIRDDIKLVKKNLTHSERLRKDLLQNYDPYVRPVENFKSITTVGMKLVTHSLTLDEHKSIMEVKGICKLHWKDEKLIWNSTKYGGLEMLHIYRREIWQPDLILFNAVGDGTDILQDSLMIVNSAGFVQWTPPIHLRSWCSSDDFEHWPKDIRRCDLMFSFAADADHLRLNIVENGTTILDIYSSEWIIEEAEVSMNSGWPHNNSEFESQDTFKPSTLSLCLTLQRSSYAYSAIFFSPYVVVSTALLTSFWLPPFGYTKMTMQCFHLISSSLVLLGLGMYLPVHSKHIPYIVKMYSYSIVTGVASILVSIVVINLSRNEKCSNLSNVLTNIISSKTMGILLCLPKMKITEDYGKLSNVSLQNLGTSRQAVWILLGTCIDRIAFFINLAVILYFVSTY